MASAAVPGYGAKLYHGGTTSSSATQITEITSITGPGMDRDAIDVTHLNSASNAREFIAGVFDGGEVTVEMNYDPADATQVILTEAITGTSDPSTEFVVSLPDTDATEISFTAIPTGFSPNVGGVSEGVTASATLKVSGAVKINSGS